MSEELKTFDDIQKDSEPTAPAGRLASERLREISKDPAFYNPYFTISDALKTSNEKLDTKLQVGADIAKMTSDTDDIIVDTLEKSIMQSGSLGDRTMLVIGNHLSTFSDGTLGVELRNKAFESLQKRMKESDEIGLEADAGTWAARITGGAYSMAELLAIGIAGGSIGGLLVNTKIGIEALSDGGMANMRRYMDEHDGSLDGYTGSIADLAVDYGNAVYQIATEKYLGVGKFLNGTSGAFVKEALDGFLQESLQSLGGDVAEALKGNQEWGVLAENAEGYIKDGIVGAMLQGPLGAATYRANRKKAKDNIRPLVEATNPNMTAAEVEAKVNDIYEKTEQKRIDSFAEELVAETDAQNDVGKMRANLEKAIAASLENADMSEKKKAQFIESYASAELDNAFIDSLETKKPLSEHAFMKMESNQLGVLLDPSIDPKIKAEFDRLGKQLADLQSQMKAAQESKNYAEADRLEAEIANIRKTAPQTLDALGKGVYADNILAMKMAEGAVEARRKREEAQTKALLAESSAREKQEKAASKTLGKGAALGTDGTQTKPAPAKRTYSQKQALRQVIGSISRDMSANGQTDGTADNVDYQSGNAMQKTEPLDMTDSFADLKGKTAEEKRQILTERLQTLIGAEIETRDGKIIGFKQPEAAHVADKLNQNNAPAQKRIIAAVENIGQVISNAEQTGRADVDVSHNTNSTLINYKLSEIQEHLIFESPVKIGNNDFIVVLTTNKLKADVDNNRSYLYEVYIRKPRIVEKTQPRGLSDNNITEDGQNVKDTYILDDGEVNQNWRIDMNQDYSAFRSPEKAKDVDKRVNYILDYLQEKGIKFNVNQSINRFGQRSVYINAGEIGQIRVSDHLNSPFFATQQVSITHFEPFSEIKAILDTVIDMVENGTVEEKAQLKQITPEFMSEYVRASKTKRRKLLSKKFGESRYQMTIDEINRQLDNFKQWFGDSKVVDSAGNPLVVYHGTNAEFDTFDKNRTQNKNLYGFGFYFAKNKKFAETYGHNILEAYLKIENPIDAETYNSFVKQYKNKLDKLSDDEIANLYAEKSNTIRESTELFLKMSGHEDARRYYESHLNEYLSQEYATNRAIENGYDGIISEIEGIYVAFSPTQIKSATSNNGNFDPNDPNIYHQGKTQSSTGDSFRGAFLNREQIILFGELADASTLPHEFGHYWVQNNFKWQRSGLASEEFKRRWAAVERYLGIKEYDQFLSNRASEKFARAYEQFLGTEKVPLLYAGQDGVDDEAVKEAFLDFNEYINDVYDDMSGKYFEEVGQLPKEILDWFNKNSEFQSTEKLVERGVIGADEGNEIIAATNAGKAIDAVMPSDTFESGEIGKSQSAARFERDTGVNVPLEYNRRDVSAAEAAADRFIGQNEELAWDIIKGSKPEQGGLFKTDLIESMKAKLIADNDVAGLRELSIYDKTAGIEAGQRLQSRARRESFDFVDAMARLDNVLSKSDMKAIEAEAEAMAPEVNKAAFDWNEAIDNNFFNELECK